MVKQFPNKMVNIQNSELVDTHCHIHFDDYGLAVDDVIQAATTSAVTKLICVGCTLKDSNHAIDFAAKYQNIWASIGLHPHEAKDYVNDDLALQAFRGLANKPKVIAIGETGLDYFYNHSDKADQKKLLRFQLGLAEEFNLPMIFHVRQAFDDFWEIFDDYKIVGGVVDALPQ